MILFFDATYGNTNPKTGAYMDSAYYGAGRELAKIPGLTPLRVYYPGQCKTYAGKPVDGSDLGLVEQLGRDWATEKVQYVLFDDERPQWNIPPLENPNVEANVQKWLRLIQAYQFGHPGAKVGVWDACPPPPGHAWTSITSVAYEAYKNRVKPLTDVVDLSFSCHYTNKPMDRKEWLKDLIDTRRAGVDYPQPWVPTICPAYMSLPTGLSADDLEYQVEKCFALGAFGVFIWCGNATYQQVPFETMQRIERLASGGVK